MIDDRDLRQKAIELLHQARVVLREAQKALDAGEVAMGLQLAKAAQGAYGVVVQLCCQEGEEQDMEHISEIPDVKLTPKALHYLEQEEGWLAQQPREHSTALLFNCVGDVCAAVRFEGDRQSVEVKNSDILQEAQRSGAVALWLAHNHPDGSTQSSTGDAQVTRNVQELCKKHYLQFMGHHVVPGVPIQEAESLPSDWDVRVAKAEAQPAWFRTLMTRRGFNR